MECRMILLLVAFLFITIVSAEQIVGKNSISYDDVKHSMDVLSDFLSDEYSARHADVDTDIANDQSSCVEDNIAYIGNNINAKSNIASWRACSEYCRTIPTCNAWSYQRSGGYCYAKTSDKGRSTFSSYVSGAKSCPPINGGWGAWMPYLTCSKTCGPGTQQRFRYCNNPAPKYNGLDCSGQASQSRSCNVRPCPVNGGWADWMAWTTCSGCMGTQQRFRYCINPAPAHGGVTCPGVNTQSQSCMLMGAGCHGDDEPKDEKHD